VITYLERYLDNEHLTVWAELVAQGPAIRQHPLYADAQAVAREMMTRARHNIDLLVQRLKTLEYRFIHPEQAWRPPDAKHLAALEALERHYGPFPLAIHMWYEIVGSVNFMGAHPKLSRCWGYDWGGSDQLRCYGDPMVVGHWLGNTEALMSFYLNYAEDEEEEAQMEAEEPPPYDLRIGLSAINKAGESGGGGVEMLVPNAAFDAPLIDADSYWTGTFFVSYLRACFEWGGFPGLQGGRFAGRQWIPDYSRAELDFLTQDLLPL
jgi:hypothetical protein